MDDSEKEILHELNLLELDKLFLCRIVINSKHRRNDNLLITLFEIINILFYCFEKYCFYYDGLYAANRVS